MQKIAKSNSRQVSIPCFWICSESLTVRWSNYRYRPLLAFIPLPFVLYWSSFPCSDPLKANKIKRFGEPILGLLAYYNWIFYLYLDTMVYTVFSNELKLQGVHWTFQNKKPSTVWMKLITQRKPTLILEIHSGTQIAHCDYLMYLAWKEW